VPKYVIQRGIVMTCFDLYQKSWPVIDNFTFKLLHKVTSILLHLYVFTVIYFQPNIAHLKHSNWSFNIFSVFTIKIFEPEANWSCYPLPVYIYIYIYIWSRDSSVNIALGKGLDDRGSLLHSVHLPPTSAEVKKTWICTSSTPPYIFMA
jgi:hypothetical protein